MTASKPGSHNKANIIAVVGSTGTGKGRYIKTELLARFPGRPVIVWSTLEKTDNYAAILHVPATSKLSDIIASYKAGKSGVLVPPASGKELEAGFDRFCRAVQHMEGAVILIEELSRVTQASYAPPEWQNVCTAGRHAGIVLIGTCQRPAQVDKDFFGNTTEARCFRVAFKADAQVMAETVRGTVDELLDLPDFHYVHRHRSNQVTTRGILGVCHGDFYVVPVSRVAKNPQTAKKARKPAPGKTRKKP